MPAPKKVNLEKAAATVAKRKKVIGPTIEVRAIARGQYGYPYARLIEKGTVFQIAVKDLTPPKGGVHPTTGLEYVSIEYDGKEYGLPSWVVDASLPVVEEDEEDLAETISGRPSRRATQDQSSDDDDVL